MPLRTKTLHNNIKSESVSQEKEKKYTEQTFRNMVWFYREELLKVNDGLTMKQVGLSKREIGNLKKQRILRLASAVNEKTLLGKRHLGNGRFFVLTEKAKLVLKEMVVGKNQSHL